MATIYEYYCKMQAPVSINYQVHGIFLLNKHTRTHFEILDLIFGLTSSLKFAFTCIALQNQNLKSWDVNQLTHLNGFYEGK